MPQHLHYCEGCFMKKRQQDHVLSSTQWKASFCYGLAWTSLVGNCMNGINGQLYLCWQQTLSCNHLNQITELLWAPRIKNHEFPAYINYTKDRRKKALPSLVYIWRTEIQKKWMTYPNVTEPVPTESQPGASSKMPSCSTRYWAQLQKLILPR